MSEMADIPPIATAATAVLLVAGSAITLIGALGLLRLPNFAERVHAPTLGTTLGMACIAVASMIYFSALQMGPVLHEVLIVIFVTVTTPISLLMLVPAALMRDRVEDKQTAPPQGGGDA
jgi:multicomponent K+:H+ antiporter subunit G